MQSQNNLGHVVSHTTPIEPGLKESSFERAQLNGKWNMSNERNVDIFHILANRLKQFHAQLR
jgi:hypothetical protein